jgi:membrane fusion protein, multidrug efflux system
MQRLGSFNSTLKMSGISIIVLISLLWIACGGKQPPAPSVPEVAVITVELEPVALTTELPGRTAAYRIAEIRPQVNGLIQKRLFTEGADVKAGEVLYQVDPAPFQAAYDNARAALARSQANLPATKARAERYKDLVTDKAVSQQNFDDADAALRQLEADIQSWEAAVKSARINLEYTRITAPISGRIGKSNVTEGAIVTAYQPLALTTVQQLDPIYVDVQQSTSELLRLKRRVEQGWLDQNGGSQKQVTLSMEDGTPYTLDGTLQFRDVSVNPGTGSVVLRIVFPNPDGALLPGMFVRAKVMEGVNDKAILIPQPAVTRNTRGEPYALTVDAENKIQIRPLTLDRAIDDKWLVSAGLEPGDRVVIEGSQRVRPGVTVTVAAASTEPATGAQAAPQAK